MFRASLPSLDVAQLLGRGLEFHRAGNLASAQLLYGQILAVNRSHFDALHLLGVLRHQQGRVAEAHELLSSAYRVDPAAVDVLLNIGAVLQDLGRHEEAVATYDRILAMRPRHVEALTNRGMALWGLDRPAGAVMSIDRAIAIDPDFAWAHYSRACLMLALGRNTEALASYDTTLAMEPDHGEAHCGRGRALAALKKPDAALASFTRALALRPDDTGPRFERGKVLTTLRRHHEALAEYDKVLAAEASHVGGLNGRGTALESLGRLDEAQACYDQALALDPDDASAHDNRGHLLQQLRRFDEALAHHDQALALCPDDVGALVNRGTALQGMGRHVEAIASFDSALTVLPDDLHALNCRGAALVAIKMYEDALTSVEEALAIAPENTDAHCNRANALAGLGRLPGALESFEKALMRKPPSPRALDGYADCAAKLCDWTRTARIEAELPAKIEAKASIISPPTLLGYYGSPALQLTCARRFAEQFARGPHPLHSDVPRQHDKLRVAYLSANFNDHPVAHQMVNLFERHDRAKFEITGISFGANDRSEVRARIVAAFDRFHDVRDHTDRDIAEQMAEREIDIAVDLMGYTDDARPGILAHRATPIQISYFGFPCTMGADFIDYIIADSVVVPSEAERFFAEKIVRLPDCYRVTDARRPISGHTPTRMEAGLPELGFVFCSFDGHAKITAAVFGAWMHLLTSIEGSVLWLSRGDANADENLQRAAAVRGVDPGRLVFAERIAQADNLERLRLADLFLDTCPHNAHAASSDALWAGVPVLTCRGDAFAGRIGASLLQSVGLPELVTSNLADYEAMAAWLAKDPALLGEIRKRLAENRLTRPLFDTDLSRRHLESAYAAMWRLHQSGESPRSFSVEPGAGIGSTQPPLAAAC